MRHSIAITNISITIAITISISISISIAITITIAIAITTPESLLLRRVLCDQSSVLHFNFRAYSATSVDSFVRVFVRDTHALATHFRASFVDMLPWRGGEGNFEVR